MTSLRRTLTIGTVIGSAAVLLSVGVLVYVMVRAGLVEQFDQSLIDKARLLASTIELEEGSVDLQFSEFDMHEFKKQDMPGYMQLWYGDGSVLYRSPSLTESNLAQSAGPVESPAYYWLELPDGRSGRAVGIAFAPKIESDADPDEDDLRRVWKSRVSRITLVLARGTALIDQTLTRLELILLLAGTLAIAISGAVLWLVIRRSLHPVNALAGEIGHLAEDDLSARVIAGSSVRELRPVTERLNDLLGRLEAAFERERSFSADVAHELRTPLAGLRSTMDVILSKQREAPEYREALGDSLQIIIQMHAMVENLLTLARLEAGQIDIQAGPVALNELVRSVWEPSKEAAESRKLNIEWQLGPEASLSTDKSLLGMAVRNVFENAVTYADQGGSVKIVTEQQQGSVDIRVANSGSRLSQDDAEHAFDRFWRGDSARSEAGMRCGLGLSLVRKIVSLLGGGVSIRSESGGKFEITLSLPRTLTATQPQPG